jgi:hypothetical protein
LWAAIDVELSLTGRLLKLLYKTPILSLEVFGEEGSLGSFRLVPGMARAGFLLSPFVGDRFDFAAISAGHSDLAIPVSAIRVSGGWLSSVAYRTSFEVDLATLEVEGSGGSQEFAGGRLYARWLELKTLSHTLAVEYGETPKFTFTGTTLELFAHAPSAFAIESKPNQAILEIGFGLRDGSWMEGETDGVCFRVHASNPGGAQVELWSRCLDPLQVEADRGPQRATIEIPGAESRLHLSTDPRDNANWDWSYWNHVQTLDGRD